METLSIENIRAQFPTLHQEVNGKPLVYLDNGATAQKPQVVIDALNQYYNLNNSNVHRGVHHLSAKATEQYEEARKKVANFINSDNKEIVFAKGTTEGINLVANGIGKLLLDSNSEVIISAMEHHANIVPWQIACEQYGAKLKIIPINERGELILEEFNKLLTEKTKIIAVSHISNALGTINPIKEIIEKAHARNIPVLIDGAQAVPHQKIDVKALDVDFYVFSGHKMYAPTGIGVLYAKQEWLEKLPVYQSGGDMIKSVSFEKTTYADIPLKFEAGTPNIAGAIALGTAIDFINEIGFDYIQNQETTLLEYATQQISTIEGIKIHGTAKDKTSILSFNYKNVHPYDIGVLLDKQGVAVRTGHHCAQPIMDEYNIPGTVRASFAFYNTKDDIDIFIKALHLAIRMLD